MSRQYSHHVAPRYSPGSPALVSEAIANEVARDERRGYEAAMSGIWGDEWKAKAGRLGLGGIVEEHDVFANHIIKTDVLTGKVTDTRDAKKAPAIYKRRVRVLGVARALTSGAAELHVDVATFASWANVRDLYNALHERGEL